MRSFRYRIAAASGLMVVALASASCSFFGGSQDADKTGEATGTTMSGPEAGADSVANHGGMDGLIAAAQKEGSLTVVGMPADSAGLGELLRTFRDKYQIAVNSVNPTSGSAAQLDYAASILGQPNQPDVFNLEAAFAGGHTDAFSPYRIQAWDDIPAAQKDPGGAFTGAYTGTVTVGYDPAASGQVTGLGSLQAPAYKGKIALAGNPADGGAALAGLMLVGAASGSGIADIATGLTFFTDLRKTGNLVDADPTIDAIRDGSVAAVIDWSFNQTARAAALNPAPVEGATDGASPKSPAADVVDWRTFTPPDVNIGVVYAQAINKDAPHPAAARLWLEYVFSPEAATIMATAGARPTTYDALVKAGALDKAVASAITPISGEVTYASAAEYLAGITAAKAGW